MFDINQAADLENEILNEVSLRDRFVQKPDVVSEMHMRSCKSRFRGQLFFSIPNRCDTFFFFFFCDAELNLGNLSSILLLSCSPSAYSVPGLLSDKPPLLPRSLWRGYYRTNLPSSFILWAGFTFGQTFHPLLPFILHVCTRIIRTDIPVAYIFFLPSPTDAFP